MLAGEEDIGRNERVFGFALLLVLLAGVVAAVAGRRLPTALGPTASDELFSAGRALQLLESIARAPHPVGSDEHECVREFLVERLSGLGFSVEQQKGVVKGSPLTNLLVGIPGSAPTGTVLCLAHYDSEPTGPGAGDDGAGVVAWLEGLRALRARGWQPRNNVVLLLSDGEELVLLGAVLFVKRHPLAPTVKTVINLEAIGNGGPALLFQLGPGNGARVREFADCIDAPSGSSLGDGVFRVLPNDTDLTVFLVEEGIAGFNLALTSGSPAYHAPHDTPENIDPRSLQHMGDCALALVERVGELDLATLTAPDVTFFDLFGRQLVSYARAWDVVLVLLGLALVLHSWARSKPRARELAALLAGHAKGAVRIAFLVTVGWWLLDRLVALVTPSFSWVPGNTTSGALLGAGLVLWISGWAARERREPSAELHSLAAEVAWGGAALLALLWMPGSAFVFYGPLILMGLGRLAERPRFHVLARTLQLLLFAAALFLSLPILLVLVQLLQRVPALAVFVIGGVLASAVGLFALPLRSIARAHRHGATALLVLGGGALCASILVARVLAWRTGALWP